MKTYTFRITLPYFKHMWRTIEMHADQTLPYLHNAIQHAFEFDDDHLYSFFMSGKAWDKATEYALPEGVTPWDSMDAKAKTEDDELEIPEFLLNWGWRRDIFFPKEQFHEARDLPLPEWVKSIHEVAAMSHEQYKDYLKFVSEKTGQRLRDVEHFISLTVGDYREYTGADDVRRAVIDKLNLSVGKEFLYLFDYGDQWEFIVKVEAINPNAPQAKYPRIVESMGQAPEQYPDWDDYAATPEEEIAKIEQRFQKILAIDERQERLRMLLKGKKKGFDQLYALHDYLAFALGKSFPAVWRAADKNNKITVQKVFVDNLAKKVMLKIKPSKGKAFLIPAEQVWAVDDASQNAMVLEDYRRWLSK